MSDVATALTVVDALKVGVDVGFWMRKTFRNELHFSLRKIERDVRRLDRRIRRSRYQPTIVVGMGSPGRLGGFVVGALLACPRFLNAPFVPLTNISGRFQAEPASFKHVLTQIPADGARLLLVDEISKRGDTVRNARAAILAARPTCKVRVAVLVRYTEQRVYEEFHGDAPLLNHQFWSENYCLHIANRARIWFPWEHR